MNEELLMEQVALLAKIEAHRAAAPEGERKFWKQADDLVVGSRDLGVARRMLLGARMHSPVPAMRKVAETVLSWVDEKLLSETHVTAVEG